MRTLLVLLVCAIALGCGPGEDTFEKFTPITADVPESVGGGETYRRGPYLARCARTEITLIWRRIGTGSPVVGVGKSADDLRPIEADLTVRTVGPDPEDLFAGPKGCVQYEARIMGLAPGTLYHYAILDGGKLFAGGPGFTFRTHPAAGDPGRVRFWVVGDSGTGGPEQAAVHQAMRGWCGSDGHMPDLALHVGDMAYNAGTDEQFHDKHFVPYARTLRNTVLWPTIGNHDGRQFGYRTYLDAFALPTRGECGGMASKTEVYYSFDYANIHFVVLDSTSSDRRPGSAMLRWLQKDLESTKAEWLIASWHHAPHSKGSHEGESGIMQRMRNMVLPILEAHGVDLVLAGHSHIYERSMLMDGAHVTPVTAEGVIFDDGDGDPAGDGAYRKSAGRQPHEGTVYVVTGNGGGEMKRLGTSPVMKRVILVHGSMVVDVEGDTLTARMIDHEGSVRDCFSIVKQGRVQPAPVLDPARLPAFHYLSNDEATATLHLREDPLASSLAVLELQDLPEGVTARVFWDCEGTNWFFQGSETTVRMGDLHGRRPEFRLSCLGRLFPLPRPRLTWLLPQGEQEGSVSLVVPAYRRILAQRLAVEPVLDGWPTPEEQKGLPEQSDFVRADGLAMAMNPTTAWLGVTGRSLYLGLRCEKGDDEEEVAIHLRHRDRDLEIRLPADRQIASRSDGVRSKVAKAGDGYALELLVPLELLGDPAPGSELRLNLCREGGPEGERSQWSFTNGRPGGEPEFLGFAVLPID